MKGLIFAAALCALIAAPAMGNLILNGSFEDSPLNSIPTFVTLFPVFPSNSQINNWTVIGPADSSIDYVGGTWTAQNGADSLDLNGTGTLPPGGIQQPINTVQNTAYRVDFWMSGNPAGDPPQKSMTVSAQRAGLQTSAPFLFNIGVNQLLAMVWVPMSWTFTADITGLTTIQFLSTTANTQYGPALDNVSVNAVPVPAAVLIGILGLGVAGLKLRKFA